MAKCERGSRVAHQRAAVLEAEHGNANGGVLQCFDTAEHRFVDAAGERIGSEQHHLAAVGRADPARHQHHGGGMTARVERPLLAHDLALAVVGGGDGQPLAYGFAVVGEMLGQKRFGAFGFPEAQRGGVRPQIALPFGVEHPHRHIKPVVVGETGEVEHFSAARPPEGDEAPPRGAGNEVSVGAVSFKFCERGAIRPRSAGWHPR